MGLNQISKFRLDSNPTEKGKGKREKKPKRKKEEGKERKGNWPVNSKRSDSNSTCDTLSSTPTTTTTTKESSTRWIRPFVLSAGGLSTTLPKIRTSADQHPPGQQQSKIRSDQIRSSCTDTNNNNQSIENLSGLIPLVCRTRLNRRFVVVTRCCARLS